LFGVPHVQVGVEERDNFAVTGNASITRRSFCVTLLAATILALVFVVTLAEDADARRVRHKKGVAEFTDTSDFQGTDQPFQPPDRFSCRFRVDGYICTAVATRFLLNDVLVRNGNPPPGLGLEDLATPDLFQCHWDANAAGDRSAEHFSCEYRHNQQTRVFKVNEIVSTNTDDEVNGVVVQTDLDPSDLFLPPEGHALPTSVPAGADAAGEGSAAWLFGLVLAASGAMVGTVVIVRRRFVHGS
jgi:hypothetical protein